MRIRKITQNTRDFKITDAVIDGGTDLNKDTFNGMQDNIEEAIGEHYSTDEKVIGTYLGKPLYKKVVTGNTGTGDSVIILDTSFNISKLINSKGYVQMSGGNQMLINSTMASEPNNNLRVFKHYDGYVMLQFGGNFKSSSYEITLEYTKTTD